MWEIIWLVIHIWLSSNKGFFCHSQFSTIHQQSTSTAIFGFIPFFLFLAASQRTLPLAPVEDLLAVLLRAHEILGWTCCKPRGRRNTAGTGKTTAWTFRICRYLSLYLSFYLSIHLSMYLSESTHPSIVQPIYVSMFSRFSMFSIFFIFAI